MSDNLILLLLCGEIKQNLLYKKITFIRQHIILSLFSLNLAWFHLLFLLISFQTLLASWLLEIHYQCKCCYLTKNGPQNSGPFFWTFEMNVNSSVFFLMVQRRASGEFIDAYVWLGRPQPKYKRRWCASKCVSRRKSPKQKTPVRIQQNNREQKWIFPWPTQNGTIFLQIFDRTFVHEFATF